jgi:hypothetical protein
MGLKTCKPSFTHFSRDDWAAQYIFTNGYAYALNCPDVGYATPGQLQEKIPLELTPRHVTEQFMRAALRADGLIEITKQQALSGKFHAVALLISACTKQRDYQMLRRDIDGTWSYKMGDSPPLHLDSEDRPITDPYKVELYGYGRPVAYFAIPDAGISYYAPELEAGAA